MPVWLSSSWLRSLTACAGPTLKPSVTPVAVGRDALLVLPGFGYGRDDEKVFRAVAETASASGIDLFVALLCHAIGPPIQPEKLVRFIREQRLNRYERLHVFAFIAGGWTINPLVDGR